MSADAKAWQEDDGLWVVVHDGPCSHLARRHENFSLLDVLDDVGQCTKTRYAWEIRQYPDSKLGLVGYAAGGRSYP